MWEQDQGQAFIAVKICSSSMRGFTLVEVLVAISIVGVVFGVIITSAGAIQRNARNAQRETDLRAISSALQQYYADNQKYPFQADGSTLVRYMSRVPTDPSTGGAYAYSPRVSSGGVICTTLTSPCHFYYLCAAMEGRSGSGTCGANYNFEVTPL